MQAHIAIIVRSFASSATKASADSASLAEIGKKKFKKTPRPSASAVIEAAETSNESPSTKNEIEIVLLDPEVKSEDGTASKSGVVSLGRVTVEADQLVVSDDGFVTSLSKSDSLL